MLCCDFFWSSKKLYDDKTNFKESYDPWYEFQFCSDQGQGIAVFMLQLETAAAEIVSVEKLRKPHISDMSPISRRCDNTAPT